MISSGAEEVITGEEDQAHTVHSTTTKTLIHTKKTFKNYIRSVDK